MIKIMDYSKTSNEEIFYRGMAASGVEDIVAEIISDVKKNKDAALLSTVRNSTIQIPIN